MLRIGPSARAPRCLPPARRAPWLALLLALAMAPAAIAGETWAPVLYVNDGDTITVSLNGAKELVRLLGVDAPETGHSRKLARAAGRAGRSQGQEARLGGMARDYLAEFLPRGKRVRLQSDPGAGARDQHGRLLAYVYLEDGRLLNALLLEQGQARAYGRCQCAWQGRFKELEKQARRERRGLWALGGP